MSRSEHPERSLDRTSTRASASSSRLQNVRNGIYLGAAIVTPVVKGAAAASGLPGVEVLLNVVTTISNIAQQVGFNRKQSLRLAQEARRTFDELRSALHRKGDVLEKDAGFVTAVQRFAR